MANFTAITGKDGRKEYAYLLEINGKVAGTIAERWWATEQTMKTTAAGMATMARRFKRTAGILVYESVTMDDDPEGWKRWHLCHTCECSTRTSFNEFYSYGGLPANYKA